MKKKHLIITAILLLITAVIAFFYLQGRRQTPEGSLAVICEDKETIVDPFTAPSVDVAGTVVNGKGQEKELSGKGVTLSDVLSLAGFGEGDYSEVRVVSSDEYAAQISAQEITSRSMNSTAVGSQPQASTFGTAPMQASRSSKGSRTESFFRYRG